MAPRSTVVFTTEKIHAYDPHSSNLHCSRVNCVCFPLSLLSADAETDTAGKGYGESAGLGSQLVGINT